MQQTNSYAPDNADQLVKSLEMNTKLQSVIKELMTNAEKLFAENLEKEAKIQRLITDQAHNFGTISEETLDELKNNYVKIVKDKDNQLEN